MTTDRSSDLGLFGRITSAQVVAALGLAGSGTVISLSQVLRADSPQQPGRGFSMDMNLARLPHPGDADTILSSVEETIHVATHSGTHLDGLAHTGIGNRAFNGHDYSAIATPDGLIALGIEHVGPVITRGVFLDVAAHRDGLGKGDVVSAEDLAECAKAAAVEIADGDAVIVNTGWGALWDKEPDAYTDGEPGIGVEAARWLTERGACLIGADNWGVEAVPMANPEEDYPVHQHCLTECGCYLLENVRTTRLAAIGATTFCFMLAPLAIAGASSSLVTPVAIV